MPLSLALYVLFSIKMHTPAALQGVPQSLASFSENENISLFLFTNGSTEVEKVFGRAYAYFNETFDHRLFEKFRKKLSKGASLYRVTVTQPSFLSALPSHGSHCDKGSRAPLQIAGSRASVAAFPGGISKRMPPDFSKLLLDIAARGPPGGPNLALPMALSSAALQMGMGLVQSVVAAIIHIVPPLIPPPVWINMPLPCAPMVTGPTASEPSSTQSPSQISWLRI